MKQLCFLIAMGAMILSFSSCSNKKAESGLLIDKQSCSPEDCPEGQKKIEGSISIQPDDGLYQLNVDKSDMIEIAGKCTDLGIRDNRIFVEVYEGEDVSLPNAMYIDNSSSVNCVNSSTPSINGRRCFWVTQGKSVIDSGAEYPQCFNGRFSFSVKVGKILRTSDVDISTPAVLDEIQNPRRKYMVRFKLRTNDGAFSESPWNSTLIDRTVSKPTFGQDSLPFDALKCDVKVNAFKNLENLLHITYRIHYTPEYINSTPGAEVVVTAPIPYLEPIPVNPVAHVTNYRINNVIPGIKYKVKVKAYDNNINYSYALLPTPGITREESAWSEELQCGGYVTLGNSTTCYSDGTIGGPVYTSVPCGMIPAQAQCGIIRGAADSLKRCDFEALNFPAGITTGRMQWMVMKGKSTWADDFEPSVALPVCGTAPNPAAADGCIREYSFGVPPNPLFFTFQPENYPKNTCTFPAGTNSYNGTYGVAVRYIADLAGTQKSKWSAVVPCVFSK